MMPYNRFIDPVGTVVRFGNPDLENHSLDCILFPGGKILAVEDRYGVAFIDVRTSEVLYHLEYGRDKANKHLMSTYSGIKAVEINGSVHIFWGAANPDDKRSVVMDAVWDGKKASIMQPIEFASLAPAPLSLPNDIAVVKEGVETFLVVVLNGNSQLCKIRLSDKKVIWTTATGMAPFGIAVAEMAKAGCIVFVSDGGGQV